MEPWMYPPEGSFEEWWDSMMESQEQMQRVPFTTMRAVAAMAWRSAWRRAYLAAEGRPYPPTNAPTTSPAEGTEEGPAKQPDTPKR